MSEIRHTIGIDISTQTITAMLIGVIEENGVPSGLMISSAWTAMRPCRQLTNRKTPEIWVGLVRECIKDLKRHARETELASSIGVSTTFPGIFALLKSGNIDPHCVSLYDNTDDAGCNGLEEYLGCAETETLNRMWPGNMAIGLVHLIKTQGLRLDETAALAPPNTALTCGLLRAAQCEIDPSELISDFTQTAISGVYNTRTAQPVPPGVACLLKEALPDVNSQSIRDLLPAVAPSWRNTIPERALPSIRALLGLPNLNSISIGGGDSPIGVLALNVDGNTVVNVRGSSDTPIILVDHPRERATARETVIHYPLPSVISPADSPWCVTAPMLRSGKVWDWVRNLRFAVDDPEADVNLVAMAIEALKRRLTAPEGSMLRARLRFNTSLGGERAPDWDSRATGQLSGLIEAHGIGDIALAALEGMSETLKRCMDVAEERYGVNPTRMLLAGGPAKNALWNWITQIYTGKKTYATTFSDASLLGAAMMGYAASYDGAENDPAISQRLRTLSKLVSAHPLVCPTPAAPPDDELAELEDAYIREAAIC